MVTSGIYAASGDQPVQPIAAGPQAGPAMRPMGPMGMGRGRGHMQMLRDRIATEQNPTVKAEATDLLEKIEIGDKNIEALWTIRRDNMQKLHKTLGLPEMRPGMRGRGQRGPGGGRGPGRGQGKGYGGRGYGGRGYGYGPRS